MRTTFEDRAMLLVFGPEDVGARASSSHGVVNGEPITFRHMEAPLVRLDRHRNKGDETAQGGKELVRLIPRQTHFAPGDIRELIENLDADRAAASDDCLGSCGLVGALEEAASSRAGPSPMVGSSLVGCPIFGER